MENSHSVTLFTSLTRHQQELFSAIMHQDISFFDQNHTGDLQNRLSADTQVLQSALTMQLANLAKLSAQVGVWVSVGGEGGKNDGNVWGGRGRC